ncbi:MAG: hypothetical protein SW833_07285 [Cyanobacteriota bacterium]|nr:hypothetical protein [Cyanobacteriota bacterium]
MTSLIYRKPLLRNSQQLDPRETQFLRISSLDLRFYAQNLSAEEEQDYSDNAEETARDELPSSPTLLNNNAQSLVYLGVILFFIGIIAAIGLVNRRIAFGGIFALMVCAAIAIVFLPL